MGLGSALTAILAHANDEKRFEAYERCLDNYLKQNNWPAIVQTIGYLEALAQAAESTGLPGIERTVTMRWKLSHKDWLEQAAPLREELLAQREVRQLAPVTVKGDKSDA